MRWTERQRAMLREMGIHLWAPRAAPDAVAAPAASSAPAPPAANSARAGASSTGVARDSARSADPIAAPTPQREAEPSVPRWPGLAPAEWLVVSEPLDAGDPQQEQLLENMLRAINAGVVAPSRERRAAFFALQKGVGEGAASDAGALQEAIDVVTPRCVLALGRAAAAALLGDDVPLGGLRGRVHVRAGVPVVVTFSLAFLLRHPAEKAKAWSDLCLAVGPAPSPVGA